MIWTLGGRTRATALLVSLALLLGLGPMLPLASPAEADVPPATGNTAVITVKVGGERESQSGVSPRDGVKLQLYDGDSRGPSLPAPGSWTTCVSDAQGDCSFVVPNTGSRQTNRDRRFWIVRSDSPSDYYSPFPDQLVTGPNGGNLRVKPYRFRTGRELRAGNTYTSTRNFMIGTGNSNDVASGGIWQVQRRNPALPAQCGLNVALVLDVSGSVGSAMPQLRQAAKTFTDSLVGTPSQVGLFTFAATAPANQSNNRNRPLTSVSTQAGSNQVKKWIEGLTSGGATNWDRGLYQVSESTADYDIAVVITDGNPTVYGNQEGPRSYTRFREVEEGVFSANAVKAEGTRVIAFGVGAGLAGNPDNLKAISGPAVNSDFYQTNDFDQAGSILRKLALGECEGSVSVLKWEVPPSAPPGTVTGAVPAGGWTFDAGTTSSGVGVTPPSGSTDPATGAVNFDLAFPGGVSSAPVTITETQQPGFSLVQRNGANAECRRLDTGVSLPVTNTGALGFIVDADASYGISCDVYNRAPRPEASLTVLKRWEVNGDSFADGDQPADVIAGLTVDGVDQQFGETLTGFLDGDRVSLDETTDLRLRQCRLLSSRVTSAGGQTLDEPLPYRADLQQGVNEFTITNAVECDTRLTLGKQVVGGGADPADWELTAEGPTGALTGPTGKDGVTADVSPGERYVLSESDGDPRYVQFRDPNATITPPATGSWDCREIDEDGNGNIVTVPGFADGLNGGVRVPLGTWVACVADNESAQLTLLKSVSNDNGGGADAADWELTATPTGNPPAGLGPTTVTGSDQESAANTFRIRPGQDYTLSESGPSDYDLPYIRCVIDAVGTDNDRTVDGPDLVLGPGDAAVCTFTNDDQSAAIDLQKTPRRSSFSAAGEEINYDLVATNTGQATLNDVAIDDPLLGGQLVDCFKNDDVTRIPVPTTLQPGERLNCVGVYESSLDDLNAGAIKNTATSSGTTASGRQVGDDATATVTATQRPKIALAKSADVATVKAIGDTVTYTFNATNTGNVTLDDVTVVDPLPGLSPLTCTDATGQPTTLPVTLQPAYFGLPAEGVTCTATYTTTQNDLDAGSIDNDASATGTTRLGRVVKDRSTASVPADVTSAISMEKVADLASVSSTSDTITYTFRATNTGTTTLNDVTVSDPLPDLSALACRVGTADVTPPVRLFPGETLECTASYDVKQTDIDAGGIDNTATASGTPVNGGPVSADDSETVPADRIGELTVTKRALQPNYDGPGQEVNYAIEVRNTGTTTLTDLSVSDSLISGPDLTCQTPTSLAPNASFDCQATTATTQADVDAGQIVNTATATGTTPSGARVTASDTATLTGVLRPGLSLTKTADLPEVSTAGQIVTYTFTATNTGNLTLDDVSISDPLQGLSPLACADGSQQAVTLPVSLAAGSPGVPAGSVTCTATYTTTLQDIDDGGIDNTATATGTPQVGKRVRATDSASVPAAQSPALELTKNASPTSVTAVGDVITYTYTARNTGNTSLLDLTISDPMPGLSALDCTPTQPSRPAPGGSLTCTATYTVTQADIDAGAVINTATATATDPSGAAVDDTATATVAAQQAGALTVTKTASVVGGGSAFDGPGAEINYTIVARNSGNTTVTDVSVSDPLFGSAIFCSGPVPATLAPGEELSCQANWETTQVDVDAGKVVNTATATGTDPSGTVTGSDTVTVPGVQRPKVQLTKTPDRTEVSAEGQTVTYTFEARNSGNVTLNGVSITDDLPGLSALNCPTALPAVLRPGESLTCTATYAATQADIDAGGIDNSARVFGTSGLGRVVKGAASASVPASQTPTIDLVKAAAQQSVSTPRDRITYAFQATNRGNVTLSDVQIADPLNGLSQLACDRAAPVTLAPGEQLTCSATYTVTQADIDAGGVQNEASGTGDTPTGGNVVDKDAETVPAVQTDTLSLTKTVAPATFDAAGTGLTYTLTARNGGNTTLTDVTITDPLLGGAPDCRPSTVPATLRPGESLTCVGSYVTEQADVDAGRVVNTATTTGTTPGGQTLRDTATVTVPGVQRATITLDKSADRATVGQVGQTVTYGFTVRNTGNVTLDDVTVADPLTGLSALTCDRTAPVRLDPGSSVNCSATYDIDQADLDAGGIDNTATAAGTPPSGNRVSATDSQTVTADQSPGIALTKQADKTSVLDAGETITYTFTASNTGNTTLSGVRISDPLPGLSALSCSQPTALAPGEQLVCTATYVVSQADIDAGAVPNAAVTEGTSPDGRTVDASSNVTVPARAAAKIALLKSPSRASVSAAGDVITYTFSAENTGNVTLSGVTIDDPLPGLSRLVCQPALPATLSPNEGVSCDADYTVTQADIDAGGVLNAATATGAPPSGPLVKDGSTAVVPASQTPGIFVTKSADTATVSAVGDVIGYTLTAKNTGNTTLSGVELTDSLIDSADLVCDAPVPATLGPQEVLTCNADYTVTQQDLDRGRVANTATGTGTPPSGPAVTETADVTVDAAQNPAIALTKTAGQSSVARAGDRIDYTFEATNTGNVTLDVSISDPLPDLSALACSQPAALRPGESLTCTAEYTVKQSDIDAGAVANTATTTGTPPSGPDVTAVDSQTVPAAQASALLLRKSADVTSISADGDAINYTFTAENTGNTTLKGVAISDPLQGLSPLQCTQPTTLAPGGSLTCTAAYSATQGDIDAGGVANTATVTGTTPTGQSVSATDGETVPSVRSGKIVVAKVADVTSFSAVDTPITYTVTIENAGTVTLSDVSLTDDLAGLGAFDCSLPVTLSPGDTLDCRAVYRTTQADIDAGGVFNAAAATGVPPDGPAVKDLATLTVPSARTPRITLDKAADVQSLNAANDPVRYTFTARNEGNTTLSAVEISDPLQGLSALSCTQPTTLAPGESLTCTADYAATQRDIDAGGVSNTATVTGTATTGAQVTADDSLTIPAPAAAKIRLSKSANTSSVSTPREVITYTFEAQNAGNVTLRDVEISDPLQGLSPLACSQPADLAPGETLTCTADYTTTQADIDAGGVLNTASAGGVPPTGPVVKDQDAEFVPATRSVGISLVKSADTSSVDREGESVEYTFTARNDSNVTLSDVSITDPLQGLSPLACSQPAVLAPGETLTCTADYTTTQADIDAGRIENTATVTGRPPASDPITATDDLTVPARRQAELTLTKSADVPKVSSQGDPVVYTLEVENTGNVTVADVTVNDPLIAALTCDKQDPVRLAPGETLTCTGDYAATQADIDAGGIDNSATVTGKAPGDSPVDASDSVSVPADAKPALSLSKGADKPRVTAVGEQITYAFTARNEGNVTLDVSVTDPLPGLSALSCGPSAKLAPGADLTCTATYAVGDADAARGSVENTATATGRTQSGATVEASDTATVTVDVDEEGEGVDTPGIQVTKQANKSGPVKRGAKVKYTYTVSNTGGVALYDIRVVDDKCSRVRGPSGDVNSDGVLEPGEQWVYTCTSKLRKTTRNTVVASGEYEPGQRIDSFDSVRVKVAKRQACPIVVKVVKPKPKKAGNRILIKRIKTNKKCKRLKPIVICRPLGSGASGETAFCTTKVTKRGRVRVNTRGYDAVRVRVLVRAKPKPKQRDRWKANTWRRTWTLR